MLRYALVLAASLCAVGANAQDFRIVPIFEDGNWQQTDMPPAPPLTVFTEFSKAGGVDPVRATVSDLDYLETGLHKINSGNASSYGLDWNDFLDALIDPVYTEFAIGWNSADSDERFLIPWLKPTSATVTDWWLRVFKYETAELSSVGLSQLVVETHVQGSAVVYPVSDVPEPSAMLLAMALALCGCRRRFRRRPR